MPRTLPVLLAGVLLVSAAPVLGLTIDFDDFDHGEIVANRVASYEGWTLFADNPKRSFDIAVAFDTTASGSDDPDLEMGDGWSRGNLAPDTVLGRALIMQRYDNCGATMCAMPDDDGDSRPSFLFLFDEVFQVASFDLIDVDSVAKENGSITFYNLVDGEVDNEVARFTFDQFLDLGQGVHFGNDSANHVDLGQVGPFNALEITLGGSGAIDNIAVAVPEPTTAALLALGMVGLGAAGRRRVR